MTDTAVEKVGPDTESIGRKAGRGLGWGLLGNFATKLGSFATALVLARLLVPDDFGAYAVALAATQFVIHINDVGLIPATIQWRGRLEEMAPTATTIAGGFSLVVYLGFWFAAPSFAEFSGVPEATPVIRLFTATILIDGITAVRGAYLLRTFQQKRFVQASMAGIVADALVTISMAAAGAGPMALAGGQVASSLVAGALVWIWAALPLRIGIDRAVARKLLAYGIPLALSLGVEAVLEQADKVLVGRMMGAGVLGFYLLAASVSNWAPSLIGTAIRFVALPGFSRLSEKDSGTLSSGVQRTIPLLVTGLIPIAVLLAVLAEPTIALLYGSRWLAAVEPLRFLMILMMVRMLYNIGMDILMSTAATRWALLVNLGWAAAVIPGLWFGTKLDGGRGAAIAQALVGVLVALPLTALALRSAGVRLAPIAPRLVRPLLAGALTAAVALLLHRAAGTNALVQLGVAGTAGLLVYLSTAVRWAYWRAWTTAMRRHGRVYAVAE